MGALRRAGHRVAPFKVGPDFIDPGYHALATGLPGRNLDPVLVGESLIGPLYRHGTAGADIAVVEGVMGLFDGRIDEDGGARPTDPPHTSRACSARRWCGGRRARPEPQHRGAAARVLDVRQVGPDRRGDPQPGRLAAPRGGAAQACEHAGVPVLGRHPRADELSVPSRHLGW